MRRPALGFVFFSGISIALLGCGGSGSGTGTGGHGGTGGGAAGASGHGGGAGTSAAGTSGAGGQSGGGAGGSSSAGAGGTATAGAGGHAGGGAGGSSTAGAGGTATAGAGGHAGGGAGGSSTAGAGGAAGATCTGTAGRGGAGGAAGAAAGAAGGAAGAAGVAGGAGGAAGAAGGAAGAAGAAGGASGAAGATAGAGGADPVLARGEYLVKNVLGCPGCHTPSVGGTPDNTRFLGGVDCFVSSGCDCLSSANLTNDATGIKNLTDQQVKDAFRLGKDPDQSGAYLFSTMPYYQFANVNESDASAIVAYLRSVPVVNHEPAANAGKYATQPTSAQNAPVDPAALPAGSGTGAANGKYMATLACVTCHTVDSATAMPKQIDATKAFQGGRVSNVTIAGTSTPIQTSNLTPDATGIMGWTAANVATAIKMGKDNTGKTICGMRTLANMTDADATDIGTYLTSIPAVANALTMLCP